MIFLSYYKSVRLKVSDSLKIFLKRKPSFLTVYSFRLIAFNHFLNTVIISGTSDEESGSRGYSGRYIART